MANRDMKLDVLVRLRDQMTGGLNRLTSGLQKVGAAARKIGMVGTVIAGISFMGPMQEAAAFQQQLLDIAGTAELTGHKAFKFVEEAKAKYEQMGLEIGQASETIAEGAGRMIAAGVDVDQVANSIRDIGEAATAANADFNDMAGVAQSLMLNLQVPADQVRDSLGALVVAGKLGSFELKDMAKEFPNLTSQVAKFGVTGREAVNFLGSGLQIAMKGAAETSVAANNFSNFLAKALAPRTVKNFKNMGVDIQAVMQDAAAKGINPLEAMLQKVQKLTGVSQGDINKYMARAKANGLQGAEALGYVRQQLEKIGAAGKISELFNDQQVLDFIVPMMANIEEFKSIKEQVAKATGAMTDKDFETQMQGINRQMVIFKEIGTQASREVGLAFGGWLPMINGALSSLLKRFREMDAASGGVLKKALSFGAGMVLLAAGIGVVGLALPLVISGFSALAAVVGLVFSPIGLVIGLLAAGAVMIWKNWDKVAPKLAKFWTGIKKAGSKAWDGIKKAWGKMSPYMSGLWARVKTASGQAWNWIADKGTAAWAKIKSVASNALSGIDWDQAGVTMIAGYDAAMRGLGATWDWLGEVWESFKPSLKNIGESLSNAFGALGGTWENIKGIGSGLVDLAAGIGKLMGLGDGTGAGFARFLGEVAGGIGELAAMGINLVAQALHMLSGALRSIVDLANGKTPDWRKYFPEDFVKWIDSVAAKIQTIREAFAWFSGGDKVNTIWDKLSAADTRLERFEIIKADIEKNNIQNSISPGAALVPMSDIKINSDAYKPIEIKSGALAEFLNIYATRPDTPRFEAPRNGAFYSGSPVMGGANNAANSNYPAMKPIEFVPPPPQKVDVNSKVTVTVNGPGTATVATKVNNPNSAAAPQVDGGDAVGRP